MRVNSMAMDGQNEQPTTATNSLENSQPAPSPLLPPSPKGRYPKVLRRACIQWASTRVRINGRIAMVGFVAALAVELSKGQDVFAQISNGRIPLFLGTSILLSVASLVPLLKKG